MAQASSIVALGVSTSTPSVISLDAIEPDQISGALTPSIVALGDPVPAVTDETVAAIPESSEQGSAQTPMIIRGGIVGGAFATPAPAASAKTTAPANGTVPAAATPPNGTAAAVPNGGAKSADNKPAATANASVGQAQPQTQSRNAPKLPRIGKAM